MTKFLREQIEYKPGKWCKITLGVHTVGEKNQRGHWAKAFSERTKPNRDLAGYYVRKAVNLGMLKTDAPIYKITLCRVAPRLLDDDNLASALSAVRDGVADGLGIANDRDPRLSFTVEQKKSNEANTYGVVVIVKT